MQYLFWEASWGVSVEHNQIASIASHARAQSATPNSLKTARIRCLQILPRMSKASLRFLQQKFQLPVKK